MMKCPYCGSERFEYVLMGKGLFAPAIDKGKLTEFTKQRHSLIKNPVLNAINDFRGYGKGIIDTKRVTPVSSARCLGCGHVALFTRMD